VLPGVPLEIRLTHPFCVGQTIRFVPEPAKPALVEVVLEEIAATGGKETGTLR
jgi:hypothetical protein